MARSNNNNKLKAFVRFDGSGRIIPSSLIVQAFKPKVGNWQEIDAKECCNYTTTTTTTVAPTTTTTTTSAPVAYSITTSGVSSAQIDACTSISEGDPVTTVYGSSNPLTVTAFYTDSGLTTLFTGDGINFFYGYHLNSAPSVNYSCELSLGGSVSTQTLCV
jgi:hypothetical protein